MKRICYLFALILSPALLVLSPRAVTAQRAVDLSAAKPGRDPKQAIDSAYTKKILEYTTEKFFNSPLTDYLPASKTVPTPMKTLGNIAGAPGKLPYSKEVYEYMRLLEKSTPRVKVYSIGTTEEGREMIAVAIGSEKNMAGYEANRAKLAKLADPRTINMNDAEADKIIPDVVPVYYITGTIHSTEAGAPTAMMELAYRLAVDESPYIKHIRDNVITLITPIVEVDGRDRVVDIYEFTKKHPNDPPPPLVYWGHYVAHDNNRDAMGMTLKLSQNVLDAYLGHQAFVLHDLHESVAYLYDNTIGDGPFNAWIDPLLANEWQMIGWNNVQEMTRMGMPGVFAHGTFDTWSPGYLMFMAAMHNGISRLYETFGNGGNADTRERTLGAADINRTWYRQNPALPRAMWSLRNNNNYEQTGLLISLNYVATNRRLFMQNFYEKSKRSIQKAKTEGPAAWVLPADDPRLGSQAELLQVMQKQHVEITRATQPFTVNLPSRGQVAAAGAGGGRGGRGGAGGGGGAGAAGGGGGAGGAAGAGAGGAAGGRGGRGGRGAGGDAAAPPPAPVAETRTFPAGSYIIRMDQPYSRIADALFDYQYWAPNDPQVRPYDDTGWTFPEGFGVQAIRITDAKVLDAPHDLMKGPVKSAGGITGTGTIFAINANADNALTTLRYKLKDADMQAAEEGFESAGVKFAAGTFIIRGVPAATLDAATKELGLKTYALAAAPTVKMHPLRAARVAMVHAWTNTQTEGWWRQAFDFNNVPYDYITAPDLAKTANLASRWDVIVFTPGGANEQQMIDGAPMFAGSKPIPYKNTPETPNFGKWAETDDTRPGMGLEGLIHLRDFLRGGGVIITAMNQNDLVISAGFTNGVATQSTPRREVDGTLLRSRLVDTGSPIAYGVIDNLAVFSNSGDSFGVSNTPGGRGGAGRGGRGGGAGAGGGRGGGPTRPTGSGRSDDQDVVQGRPVYNVTITPPAPGDSANAGGRGGGGNTLPVELRPRTILRFTDQTRDLLVSGLLDGGEDIVTRPNLVDSYYEKGHVVMFSFNPMYRGSTVGSFPLVFNTIMNWDNLHVGRR